MIEDALEADRVLNDLMGKDPAARYEFIMKSAGSAEADDLDV
jgi:DNA gyrase subunit B